MVHTKEHFIKMTDEETGAQLDATIAHAKPASAEVVELMLNANEYDDDGRSQWMLIRLQNGDLIFGTFPQGGTYLQITDTELI